MSKSSLSGEKQARSISPDRLKLLQALLAQDADSPTPIRHYPRQQVVDQVRAPASWAQQRLYFIDQMEGAGAAYNMLVVLKLEGTLDAATLHGALDALVARHEILRTVFVSADGEPMQQIMPQAQCVLEMVDLSDCARSERNERARQHERDAACAQFDLQAGPLVRGKLLRLQSCCHVLLVTMHHIVADGWSIGVFVKELLQLYDAQSHVKPDPLEALPIQYADYAQWQRQWMQGQVLSEQLDYWRARLDGAPVDLTLPTDRPRPAVKSYRGESFAVVVDQALTGRLSSVARRHGVTLFMLLFAGWAMLLSRLAGQDDVVIGTPVANRRRPELEGLIGLFVNTLALRVRPHRSLSLEQYLQDVKELTLSAYDNQDLPFDKVVEMLRPQRSANRHPLFQVMFALQGTPTSEWALPELTAQLQGATGDTAKFDLLLLLEQRDDQLVGAMNFDTDILDRASVQRWADYYRVLLEGIAASGIEQPIGLLPILPQSERSQLIELFNRTRSLYPQRELTHELFEQQVARTPHAPAVAYLELQLTYVELNGRANQLARHLRNSGVAPGDCVPVLMSRSLQMLIAQLAVLKSGAVYVPMDPELPAERLSFMVHDCAAKLIVTDRRFDTSRSIADVQWMDCSEAAAEIAGEDAGNLQLHPKPAAPPAYVMYTSGSTGVPKGVVVPHTAINRLVINNGYARIGPDDCLAHYSNPAFDASTLEVWGALLTGASCVIVPKEAVLEAAQFADILKRHHVTLMFMSVGLFNQYADALKEVFAGLHYLLVGGDTLEPAVIRRVQQQSPPQHLLNVYGPTECTTFSTAYHIDAVDEAATSIPIGRPISNAKAYILDAHQQLVPIGVVGELYIGGAGVACGYLNRPDLTAQRFLSDPFSADPAARMYKTGDLCRWRPDGTIDFVGRDDMQVKIRGFRVELGEIEAHLARYERLKEVVVIARQDEPGDKRIVAYVVARDVNDAPDSRELRAYLQERLPEYMLPCAFVPLQHVPLSSTGKVDRRALPALQPAARVSRNYEAPQGEIECIVAQVWEQLLGVQRVGRYDDFFELGGHSLLALKALFKLNRALSTTLKVKDVYSSPTVQQFASHAARGAAQDSLVDLRTEAALDVLVVPISAVASVAERSILLTGATGFVGRFLLAQLLQETDATLYCLVRAPSRQAAWARLSQTIAHWGLWSGDCEQRIVAIPADLRLPGLGLDQGSYDLLCREVDSIYHCATSMNHLETYAMAKVANVGAARELLRLATRQRRKLLNHVSTLSVFSPLTTGTARSVAEDTPIDEEKHPMSGGYAASKWVAEKIFATARDRGIPCNIFRLGLVWADTQQGCYDELQRGYRTIKSCLLSGFGIRDFHYDMPPTPVDYVARAITYLSRRHAGGVFHISSSEQMAAGLFERMNEIAGMSLQLLPYREWIGVMKRLHEQGQSLPVVPLIESVFGMTEEVFRELQSRARAASIQFSCAGTHRELELAGIPAPVLDDGLVRLCIQSMLSKDAQLQQWQLQTNTLATSSAR